jgi:hypothetical protein
MSDVHCSSTFHPNILNLRNPLTTPSSIPRSEIAELMAVKAKHSAGGEYSPDWRPKVIYTHLISCPTMSPSLTLIPPFSTPVPARRAHAATTTGTSWTSRTSRTSRTSGASSPTPRRT